MQIGFAFTVISGDGEELGTVERLVISPADNILSHFGVRERDSRAGLRAVPVWSLAAAEGGDIRLKIGRDELRLLPRLDAPQQAARGGSEALRQEPGEFPSLPLDQLGIPGEAVLVSARTEIACEEEPVGVLAGVVADDYTAEVTTLVVRLRANERLVEVPMAWARQLKRERIALACQGGDLATLPDGGWQREP